MKLASFGFTEPFFIYVYIHFELKHPGLDRYFQTKKPHHYGFIELAFSVDFLSLAVTVQMPLFFFYLNFLSNAFVFSYLVSSLSLILLFILFPLFDRAFSLRVDGLLFFNEGFGFGCFSSFFFPRCPVSFLFLLTSSFQPPPV